MHPPSPQQLNIIKSFYCLCALLITVANVLAICTILSTKRLHSITNFFIVSLSFSYLIAGAVIIPMFYTITFYNYLFSKEMACFFYKSIFFLNILQGSCCSFSQLGIAIDRYRFIITPFKKKFTSHQAFLIIACIWLFSALFAIATITLLNQKNDIQSNTYCSFNKLEHLLITCTQLSIGCGLPIISCVYLYSAIVLRLWTGSQKNISTTSTIQRNKQVIKMVIVILSLYTLCSVPFYIIGIVDLVFEGLKIPLLIEHAHNLLVICDHWLHVVVYYYFNEAFKKSLKLTLFRFFRIFAVKRCTKHSQSIKKKNENESIMELTSKSATKNCKEIE